MKAPFCFAILLCLGFCEAGNASEPIAPTISATHVKTGKRVVGFKSAALGNWENNFLPVYQIDINSFRRIGKIKLIVGYVRIDSKQVPSLKAHEEIEIEFLPGELKKTVMTGEAYYLRYIHRIGDTKGIVVAAIEGERKSQDDFSAMTSFFSTLSSVSKNDLPKLFSNLPKQ